MRDARQHRRTHLPEQPPQHVDCFRITFAQRDECRERSLGPALAWLVSYLILTRLVILLLHLTLCPFPNIAKILNPHG